ncbi:histone H4 transcription factor-like [Phlebotomus argentipes]|uniref:histone H4 transcription factor-like n=1 Tax=Phlebotomus argentipes TaxID=94469 RepID=UPI0028937098|nr:histone H4 transcription factor-like [Phlebotomus argentipes]
MPRKSDKSEKKEVEKRKKGSKRKLNEDRKTEKVKKPRTARKKKKKEEPSRPKKPQYNTEPTPENLKCLEWIKEQKRLKVKYPKIDVNVDSDTESEDDEEAESDMNLAKLSRERNKTIVNVLYNCEWAKCTALFEDASMYKDHVELHLLSIGEKKSPEFRCLWDLCKFTTEDRSAWTRHVRYHTYHSQLMTVGDSIRHQINFPRCTLDSEQRNIIPDTPYDFLCEWNECSWKTNSILDYFDHVNTHGHMEWVFSKGSKDEKIQCHWIGCEKTFSRQDTLLKHIRSHTSEKKVACDNCGSMFIHNSSFFDHCKRQLIHNTMEYSCLHCFRSFATPRLLKTHIRLHVNCHKCHLCDMTCPSLAHLTLHIRHRHLDERPFKCTQCSYTSVRQRDLESHKTIHGPRQTFECTQYDCNFQSCSLKSLKRHEALKHLGPHPKVYLCDCCGRKYSRGDLISSHLKKVHGYKLPPGSSRFFYREGDDGFYHVQTMRIESLEVTEQIMATKKTANNRRGKVKYSVCDPIVTKDGIVKVNVEEQPKEAGQPEEESEEEEIMDESEEEEEDEDEGTRLGLSMPLTEDVLEDPPPKKSIHDFTVMKRYLNAFTEKTPEIESPVPPESATSVEEEVF